MKCITQHVLLTDWSSLGTDVYQTVRALSHLREKTCRRFRKCHASAPFVISVLYYCRRFCRRLVLVVAEHPNLLLCVPVDQSSYYAWFAQKMKIGSARRGHKTKRKRHRSAPIQTTEPLSILTTKSVTIRLIRSD